jgi:hypothetical protein
MALEGSGEIRSTSSAGSVRAAPRRGRALRDRAPLLVLADEPAQPRRGPEGGKLIGDAAAVADAPRLADGRLPSRSGARQACPSARRCRAGRARVSQDRRRPGTSSRAAAASRRASQSLVMSTSTTRREVRARTRILRRGRRGARTAALTGCSAAPRRQAGGGCARRVNSARRRSPSPRCAGGRRASRRRPRPSATSSRPTHVKRRSVRHRFRRDGAVATRRR